MHIMPLDNAPYNENMNPLRPEAEKKTRIANVFVMNSGRKSIGKISAMGFNCMYYVHKVMGKNADEEEGKENQHTEGERE